MFKNTMIKYVLNNLKFLGWFGIPVTAFDSYYLFQYYKNYDYSALETASFLTILYVVLLLISTIALSVKFSKMPINSKTVIKEGLADKYTWINKLFK